MPPGPAGEGLIRRADLRPRVSLESRQSPFPVTGPGQRSRGPGPCPRPDDVSQHRRYSPDL